ncbi:MAG: CDP-glucose 4,6-dehydratase [Lachnospiraceae bacterium]|nr:CDP-glucose 4,6-dehydratase [Lachnospiraceae bacterium]
MKFAFDFYKGKKVLITGHTGFKGAWMCQLLLAQGALVTGYALDPPTEPSLYALAGLEQRMESVRGDVRDLAHLREVFERVQPEIVIHMAAQPIVRESYKDPVGTYETNVLGTVNVLECVRLTPSVRSFVNVTTDKVYRNLEQAAGYVETDVLDGYDPYSNSKSCSELVTASYVRSFFSGGKDGSGDGANARDDGSAWDRHRRADGSVVAVTTARAGNVIGGGDFAVDRIVPDCIRAALAGREIVVRNPHSTRPFQHVLEPVAAYLMIAQRQYEDPTVAGSYNVGPEDVDCRTTGELVDLFCRAWNRRGGEGSAHWVDRSDGGPHEAGLLKLDCSRIGEVFGWTPRWHVEETMERIAEWYEAYRDGGDVSAVMDRQIRDYLG